MSDANAFEILLPQTVLRDTARLNIRETHSSQWHTATLVQPMCIQYALSERLHHTKVLIVHKLGVHSR